MVHNTQNYWVSRLFQPSGILENRKHDVSPASFYADHTDSRAFRGKIPGTSLG
jgi:hypothetical protein